MGDTDSPFKHTTDMFPQAHRCNIAGFTCTQITTALESIRLSGGAVTHFSVCTTGIRTEKCFGKSTNSSVIGIVELLTKELEISCRWEGGETQTPGSVSWYHEG